MLPRTVQERSCMASSSALCVLGGVRLISSASRMFAKIGPCTKVQVRRPVVRIFFDDVGAGDVARHQVGRELDALEDQTQRLRQGAHQQGLGGAGQSGDQAVAAHKQARSSPARAPPPGRRSRGAPASRSRTAPGGSARCATSKPLAPTASRLLTCRFIIS